MYFSLILTIQKLVLSITHLTGTSTYVRAGGSYVNNNTQPGLLSHNHEKEYSDASHGQGTNFCNRVVYSSENTNNYIISTGVDQVQTKRGYRPVSSDCLSIQENHTESAHCRITIDPNKTCPKGWGNFTSYYYYLPGCHNGTYYPNPTQAGIFSPNTGSSALSSVRGTILHYEWVVNLQGLEKLVSSAAVVLWNKLLVVMAQAQTIAVGSLAVTGVVLPSNILSLQALAQVNQFLAGKLLTLTVSQKQPMPTHGLIVLPHTSLTDHAPKAGVTIHLT